MIRVSRLPNGRFAAHDDRFPGLVGYGASDDEATRALEDKLPRKPPPPPEKRSNGTLLPLAPIHGLRARDLEAPERSERSLTTDALDRAIRVGSFDSNRRRH